MGGGVSVAAQQHKLGKSQQAIVELMMPLYFESVDCTLLEHQIAEQAWNLVLTDSTPEFLARKGTDGFHYTSCVTFFYDSFYCRLFDIHPASKELFKSGMKVQGKSLVLMLSVALSVYSNPAEFDKALVKLAEMHYTKGVKAVEYGVVGDVLLWTLRKVLGATYYTPALHLIWIKIYSRMLRTIIPVAVSCELKGKNNNNKKIPTEESVSVTLRDSTSVFLVSSSSPSSNPSNGEGAEVDHESQHLESQQVIDSHREAKTQTSPPPVG